MTNPHIQNLKNMQVNELFDVLNEGGLKKAYQYKPEQYLFDGLSIDTKKFY